eukprot:10986920-Alexandrium_andersonii.AAC.1
MDRALQASNSANLFAFQEPECTAATRILFARAKRSSGGCRQASGEHCCLTNPSDGVRGKSTNSSSGRSQSELERGTAVGCVPPSTGRYPMTCQPNNTDRTE